jgi:hypothetical protein
MIPVLTKKRLENLGIPKSVNHTKLRYKAQQILNEKQLSPSVAISMAYIEIQKEKYNIKK